MTDSRDLTALEDEAYRASYSDGILDIFVGVSLAWIGAAWIWLPDLAGLAGVIPAVFIASMLAVRKRVVEPRLGYVQWQAPRRQWEHRNLAAMLMAGVALFLLGIATFVIFDRSEVDTETVRQVMPGLLAWLLALTATALGFLTGMWRLLVYAAVLAGAGVAAVWAEANPGWPLLVGGVVIASVGIAMLVDFLRRNPVLEAA